MPRIGTDQPGPHPQPVALPRAPRPQQRRRPHRHRPARHRHLRDEPPIEHGLRAGHMAGGRTLGAGLCGGRMGTGLAAAPAHPRHGRLFHPPPPQQPALPENPRPLRPDGNRGRRDPGRLSRRRSQPHRPSGPAETRAHFLHPRRVQTRHLARCRLRAGGAQLRPRDGRPKPDRRGRNRAAQFSLLAPADLALSPPPDLAAPDRPLPPLRLCRRQLRRPAQPD
jgi:hypothetical protein